MPIASLFSSHSVVQLGLKLFPILALALDLPENFFEDKVLCFFDDQDLL